MGPWSINLSGPIYRAGLRFDRGLLVSVLPNISPQKSCFSKKSWLPLAYQSRATGREASQRENKFSRTAIHTGTARQLQVIHDKRGSIHDQLSTTQHPPQASNSCHVADEDVEARKWARVTNGDCVSASSILPWLSELKAGSLDCREERVESQSERRKPIRERLLVGRLTDEIRHLF